MSFLRRHVHSCEFVRVKLRQEVDWLIFLCSASLQECYNPDGALEDLCTAGEEVRPLQYGKRFAALTVTIISVVGR